jgi:hypothetical protein
VPIVFNQHYVGTMDYWDPAVTDGLARDRELILFNNAGVSSSSGEVPTTFEEMGANAVAFIKALGLTQVDVLASRSASEDEALRFILHSVFTAALIAAPACSKAIPRTIDECEKIQAADAYNQCLALFGPVARGHGGARNIVDASSQDDGAPAGDADTKVAAVLGHGHGPRHASRHHGRHHWASHGGLRHGHWCGTTAVAHRHGKRTIMAFSTGSSRVHLR